MGEINRELCGRVADAIEGRTIPGLGFTMLTYGEIHDDADRPFNDLRQDGHHPCNTAGCGAGWAVALADGLPAYQSVIETGDVCERARHLFGMSYGEANHLFMETSATDTQMVAHLRKIAEGGPVDWSAIDPEFWPPEEDDGEPDEDDGEDFV